MSEKLKNKRILYNKNNVTKFHYFCMDLRTKSNPYEWILYLKQTRRQTTIKQKSNRIQP